MRKNFSIKESIVIKANHYVVWEFTQDFCRRKSWDKTISKISVLQLKPYKLIKLKFLSGMVTNLKYKLCQKPFKTSLRMINPESYFIAGGGGSWTHNTLAEGTQWTQVNTLVLENSFLHFFMGGLVRRFFQWSTRNSMTKSKRLIEFQSKIGMDSLD